LPSRSSGVNTANWETRNFQANQEREELHNLRAAMQRLKIPEDSWPTEIQGHITSHPTKARSRLAPPHFKPPAFDRLNETEAEWVKKSDLAWKQHRDAFLERSHEWERLGLSATLPSVKSTRGRGEAKPERKRSNSTPAQRYEWAALRLDGNPWKEIAARYQAKESAVTKAATAILRKCGLGNL
jgi:hypothetical protein